MRQPFLQKFRDYQGVAEIKPVILWMENWERDEEEPESSPLTNYLESQVERQKPWLCSIFVGHVVGGKEKEQDVINDLSEVQTTFGKDLLGMV